MFTITNLAIVVVILGLASMCVGYNVAYYGCVILNAFTGNRRSVGDGFFLIYPWEQIAPDSQTSLQKRSYAFSKPLDVEIKNESSEEPGKEKPVSGTGNKNKTDLRFTVISLNVRFELIPHKDRLEEYRSFDSDERVKGMEDRLRFILNRVMLEKCHNRAEFLNKNKIGEIADMTKKAFKEEKIKIDKDKDKKHKKVTDVAVKREEKSEDDEKIEITLDHYYGVELTAVIIADPDFPKELKDAANMREAQEQENERREFELKNLEEISASLVKASVDSGSKMPYEKALETTQIQLGKVKKDVKIFGLDRGTQDAINTGIKALFNKGSDPTPEKKSGVELLDKTGSPITSKEG